MDLATFALIGEEWTLFPRRLRESYRPGKVLKKTPNNNSLALLVFLNLTINPRPAEPLDFPTPAGGVWTPPPWSRLLIAVEKNERQRSKAREKSFRNHFGHFLVFGSGQNWDHQGSKFQNFQKRFFDNKIVNFKGRATNLTLSCLSR